MKKFIISAFISSILFSFILSSIGYVRSSEDSQTHLGFSLFLMISLPAYVIGGIPIALIVREYISNKFMQLIVFLLSGFLVGGLTAISMSAEKFFLEETLTLGYYGAFASIIYFLVLQVTYKITKNKGK
ncbi:hypothetical protein [Aquibacillus salsiterrae]|uniref:Uncharacterized protein n=1 Tax=Aquibacillus salsiterrae TaxID=2950439 RepID=A0A9X3WHT1_9BACI|nr:hypothetical protein [Aquibacillus salsiterrae]MDC3417649.1 hypothetical protein [Aquibacillus salsiterrae]